MKRIFSLFVTFGMIVALTACGNRQDEGSSSMNNADSQTVENSAGTVVSIPDSSLENSTTPDIESSMETNQPEQSVTDQSEESQPESSQAENNQMESEENNMTMNIQIGDHVLTATLVQNSSTEALIELLSEGPVTIEMNDYASMEKVGPFPQSLPRNDEQISTDAGDLILYQGNSFVIYYDTNSWNFTRLGKIDNVTKQELKDILGSGSVTAVLSLPTE